MEFKDPKEMKPKALREFALELQLRLLKVENCLDDIARAAEIAQYTKQYNVTDAFTRDAEELLRDRLTLPEIAQGDDKFTLVETTEEGLEKGLEIAREDGLAVENRKHGDIDSINVSNKKAPNRRVHGA